MLSWRGRPVNPFRTCYVEVLESMLNEEEGEDRKVLVQM